MGMQLVVKIVHAGHEDQHTRHDECGADESRDGALSDRVEDDDEAVDRSDDDEDPQRDVFHAFLGLKSTCAIF